MYLIIFVLIRYIISLFCTTRCGLATTKPLVPEASFSCQVDNLIFIFQIIGYIATCIYAFLAVSECLECPRGYQGMNF